MATIVTLALSFFGVLMSVYPIAGFSTQSVDKPIIPIWEPGDGEQTAKQTEDDDTPTPTLSSAPAQFETSGATETAIDPWTSEVVEAALREPLGTGKIRGPQLTAGWNKSQEDPKNHYRSRNGLRQAFSRFLRPKYKSPTFPDYEPTPWQEAERAEGEAVRAAWPKLISRQRL